MNRSGLGTGSHYWTKNWGDAYPLVSDDERCCHEGLDPTIHEASILFRGLEDPTAHMEMTQFLDLLCTNFDPQLWVDDDSRWYDERDRDALHRIYQRQRDLLGKVVSGCRFCSAFTRGDVFCREHTEALSGALERSCIARLCPLCGARPLPLEAYRAAFPDGDLPNEDYPFVVLLYKLGPCPDCCPTATIPPTIMCLRFID